MKKTFLFLTSALLLLTSCLSLQPQAEATPLPPATATQPVNLSTFKAGLNPQYHAVIDELSNASLYQIDFVINDNLYQITGKQSVDYTNNEKVTLNEIHFRLFPNILGGKMTVNNIKVNHESIEPKYSLNDSLLVIPLEKPLQPNEKINISMEFEIIVPRSVDLNYGVQAYYSDVLALAHAYPMIAVYDDEGWNAEIPPQSGDVAYADMSFFIVTVDAPKDLVLVASGIETNVEETGNRQRVRYEAGPVRDFYLVGSPNYQEFIREVDGVTLRFYTPGYMQAGAEESLDYAAQSIKVFNEKYGAYPYTELDFVSTPTLALGIEYPGMIAITDWIMEPQMGYLEVTVVHEVAHQWFYNLVGNDQLDEPWLDESLAQFATMEYFTERYGEEGMMAFRRELKGRWAYVGNEEIPIGLPVRDYSGVEYSGIVYGRGALFFMELESFMGAENFSAFMKSYVANNAWGISTTEILRLEAELSCGCDLGELFEVWVYR
ncbi:MAG: M1 family metallopeptidase [Anaerolineales bacterium]|nr:M1 family metallopeptidase [Anaerolineales bacterium]MBX3038526.1 M1 family metallopeptidase [Anaerolineales bacterium]